MGSRDIKNAKLLEWVAGIVVELHYGRELMTIK
jgi:hypothetical protein